MSKTLSHSCASGAFKRKLQREAQKFIARLSGSKEKFLERSFDVVSPAEERYVAFTKTFAGPGCDHCASETCQAAVELCIPMTALRQCMM